MTNEEALNNSQTLIDLINKSLRELQSVKSDFPELKIAYRLEFGSILNAYREGDLTFNEAVSEFSVSAQKFEREQEGDCQQHIIGMIRYMGNERHYLYWFNKTKLMTKSSGANIEKFMKCPKCGKDLREFWHWPKLDEFVK